MPVFAILSLPVKEYKDCIGEQIKGQPRLKARIASATAQRKGSSLEDLFHRSHGLQIEQRSELMPGTTCGKCARVTCRAKLFKTCKKMRQAVILAS